MKELTAGVGQPKPASLFCPRCQRMTKAEEWRLIHRRVLAEGSRSAGRVLQHRICEVMVYFVLR